MERDDQPDYRSGCRFNSRNDDWRATSSKRPVEDCMLAEASVKKGRLNAAEFQQREDDTHRNISGLFCPERTLSVPHETKRQNFWDTLSYNNDQTSDNDEDAGQSSHMALSVRSERFNERSSYAEFSGHTGLGFLQAGTGADGCSISSSSAPTWQRGSTSRDPIPIPGADTQRVAATSCTGDEEGLAGVSHSSDQSPEGMRGKGFIFNDGYRETIRTVIDPSGQTNDDVSNSSSRCGDRDCLNSSSQPLLFPPLLENESVQERRGIRRRRLSTTGLLDAASVQNPQTSLWGEPLFDGPGRGGLRRPDGGSCSSMNFNTAANDSITRIWEEFPASTSDRHSNSCFISSGMETSSSVVNNSSLFRTLQDQSINISPESSNSRIRSFFGSSSSQSIALTQTQNLDLTYGEHHVVEPGNSTTGAASNLDQLCNDRASASSNLVISRGSLPVPRFVVRDRASNIYDGSRIGMPSRSSRGVRRALLDGSLTSQGTSGQVLGSSNRTIEAIGQTSQVPNLISDPEGASHVLALMPNSQNAGNGNRSMLPPGLPGPVSNRTPLATSARVPRRSQSGQHTSGARAALFVDGIDGMPRARLQNILGLPFHGSHFLPSHGDQRRRLLSEILSTLEHASRNEDINFEELVMLDPSVIYRGIDGNDQHRDMRLDVDNMSYEELLALEERIGNVSTGLTEETISTCVSESKYSSLDATVATLSQESDIKCSVCQEEFVEDDELGRLDCGHGYHMVCIKQWLLLKNLCPICKSAAHSKS